eukprot:CAMPEP_0202891190 /NCGR_PEP_ID=MMETSP1392-20130828/1316_1 /ASSEMBLY_ACC=CAM_ASM_000868 /TAXON_ID=225041 /ORGANISM="Chlamydomonas chlamydogama, Strain SAG 11-48b" /LENGTH=43 /DNA_ID= /DNA_START= /DNA_END= /DNA_ORIENTATION=
MQYAKHRSLPFSRPANVPKGMALSTPQPLLHLNAAAGAAAMPP